MTTDTFGGTLHDRRQECHPERNEQHDCRHRNGDPAADRPELHGRRRLENRRHLHQRRSGSSRRHLQLRRPDRYDRHRRRHDDGDDCRRERLRDRQRPDQRHGERGRQDVQLHDRRPQRPVAFDQRHGDEYRHRQIQRDGGQGRRRAGPAVPDRRERRPDGEHQHRQPRRPTRSATSRYGHQQELQPRRPGWRAAR